MVKYRTAIRSDMAEKTTAVTDSWNIEQGNAHGKPITGAAAQGRAGQ